MSNARHDDLTTPILDAATQGATAAITLITLLVALGAQAAPRQKSDPQPARCDPKQLETSLREFTEAPHPFGSSAQQDYAKRLQTRLLTPDWQSTLLSFSAKTPSVDSFSVVKQAETTGTQAGGNKPKERQGANVMATRKGSADCAVLLGGHFDTKFYPNFRFVGANDGGSSTALLLELARVIPSHTFRRNSWGACSLHLTLFDGEEAILTDWNEGEERTGIVDHLYGSRNFALTQIKSNGTSKRLNGRKLALVLIIDMVGHRDQILSTTYGSNTRAADALISVREQVKIQKTEEFVEDDHSPFLALGVPVLHIIDWTNLKEWHTQRDTIEILSTEKLAAFGDALIRFLKTERI
jgi:glutaminyl-peptide cyclotransferase